MRKLAAVLWLAFSVWTRDTHAQPLTVDPESSVPLPGKFDIEPPRRGVPADAARFVGAWAGTWRDDRHVLVVERVDDDGRAAVVFAQSDSALYAVPKQWWRGEGTIRNGVLTIDVANGRTYTYSFDAPDRLWLSVKNKLGAASSGIMVRTDPARLAQGYLPQPWPWPGQRVMFPSLQLRTPDGSRPLMLEATYYPPPKAVAGDTSRAAGTATATATATAPLAIFSHGSDIGRNQLRTWSFSTEARWLHDHGYAFLVPMRRGRGRSEGINGEDDYVRDYNGGIVDISNGVDQALEDLESAIAYGRTLPGVRPGPVLLAGQSRGGFISMVYAGRKPADVLAVINFSGGWTPNAGPTTPYYAAAGRGAGAKVPQLWFYADNDRLYDSSLIRDYYKAYTAAGGKAEFKMFDDIPVDGHVLRLFTDKWEPIANKFLDRIPTPAH